MIEVPLGANVINKKNVLGKHPDDLGVKDAIHTAIVSVRAGALVKPGQRCGMNGFNEAVPDDDGPGVADPFMKGSILTGQHFWLLLAQDEIPNVRHDWEHEQVSFAPPTREIKRNSTIEEYASNFGVTYEQIMSACATVVATDESSPYPGTKTGDELSEHEDDLYELWSEWADETGHEFENNGTSCCPEWAHPECRLFVLPESPEMP